MVKFALLPITTVPKFSVTKYGYFSAFENKIRFPDYCFHVFTISKPCIPHCFAKLHLNRGASAFIGLHVAFALLRSKFVHKPDKYRKTM